MNREEIMRMAEASGVEDSLLYEHWRCNLESMTRFAELVASAEREAIAQMIEGIDGWNMDDPSSTAAEAIRARASHD
jgi:hypothetical protein